MVNEDCVTGARRCGPDVLPGLAQPLDITAIEVRRCCACMYISHPCRQVWGCGTPDQVRSQAYERKRDDAAAVDRQKVLQRHTCAA